MIKSVVNIESALNTSFGTGFVVAEDDKGIFLVTCRHVIDDVETPIVEDVLAKVIAKGDFIDLAVLHVNKMHLPSLPLEPHECSQLDVEVIGFSHFSQSTNQKKHIKATLFEESIELHSTEDDRFYTVRKIQSTEGYHFDRGNSGSPVFCAETGKVIAVLSNKEGNKIGYAVDIVYLKEIWKEIPSELIASKKETIETVSGDQPIESIKEVHYERPISTLSPKPFQKFNILKYFFIVTIVILSGTLAYLYFNTNTPSKPPLTTVAKKYQVVNIRNNDTLFVRSAPNKKAKVIAKIPFNANNLQGIQCTHDNWCHIQYKQTTGWVNAQYLSAKTHSFHYHKSLIEKNNNAELEVAYPPVVTRDYKFTLFARLKNNGQKVNRGNITFSFLKVNSIKYSDISPKHPFERIKYIAKNEAIDEAYNKTLGILTKVTSPMIEAETTSSWDTGEEHLLKIRVKPPKDRDHLEFCVRAAFGLQRLTPKESATDTLDQQEFPCRKILIRIIDR